MNKKMLLLGFLLSAVTAYSESEETKTTSGVDINVTATLVKPLEMTKSNTEIVGQALSGTTGTIELTPIDVSFVGAENASVKFTADKTVTLKGGGWDELELETTIKSENGSVTDAGTNIESEFALSSTGKEKVTLGGTINLNGKESSSIFEGTMNIAVNYN